MIFSKGTANTKGNLAELAAERFLHRQGLRTCCKNYRCRVGEIDLVMEDGNVLVFVEVRMRSNSQFTSAVESINYRKQQKILRAAQVYLQQRHLSDLCPCRFDVVAFAQTDLTAPDWIQNAFGFY